MDQKKKVITTVTMVCSMCQKVGKDFRVPVDEIGAELMKVHLRDEHGIPLREGATRCETI